MEKDEKFQDWLARQGIKWQFNLSRAPWWGGQFERLVALLKQSPYKTIGNGNLQRTELQEVILDVEITLNNRPLGYMEDNVELPVLTPNSLLFGQPNILPEMDPSGIEDADLRKRARYLLRCKEALWRRCSREYVKALQERHNIIHQTKEVNIKEGEEVLVKSEERNRGKWTLAVVDISIEGRDGVVRAVRLRSGKSFIERPIQHLYPSQLAFDVSTQREAIPLNVVAKGYRPSRRAAVAARGQMRAIATPEDDED